MQILPRSGRLFALVTAFLIGNCAFAQKKPSVADTVLILNLIRSADNYANQGKNDSAIIILNQAITRSILSGYSKGRSKASLLKGYIFSKDVQRRDSVSAIANNLISTARLTRDSLLLIQANKLLGHLYFVQTEWGKSMEFYQAALRVAEASNNRPEIASCSRQIGVAYVSTGGDGCPIGLKYYEKAFKIYEELKDTNAIAGMYFVMGIVYNNMGDLERGKLCQEQLIRYCRMLKEDAALARAQNELSGYYLKKGQYRKALELLQDSYGRLKKLPDVNEEIANTCTKIIGILEHLGRNDEKKPYLDELLSLAIANKDAQLERSAYTNLARYYENKQDFRKAYFYSTKLAHSLETMNLGELPKQMAEMETKYQTEKKQAQIEGLEKEKQQQEQLAALEKKKQMVIIAAVTSGLALVMIFSFFLYKRYRLTQKQAHIIESQKSIVEEKQKDILDSIHYARRIQKSLLPTDRYIQKKLEELTKSKKQG